MIHNEAQARVKINKLLEATDWRFFDDENGHGNIKPEGSAKITQENMDALGNDFQTTRKGLADYILYGSNSKPLAILEAKNENKNPLDGKEQAREYAQSHNAQYIILSNGESHYLWNIHSGEPKVITKFPTQAELERATAAAPTDTRPLADETITDDYIALTQKFHFKEDPNYSNEQTRKDYLRDNGLRILRPYQLNAIKALQQSAQQSVLNKRFLFEMATGTGKTLVSAAVIKLFLSTGAAQKVLFLVDRLELEDQANKNFQAYLQNDYETVIYKQNRNNWQSAEIVVTTVQSISSKYQDIFSPIDFDLVIADESHRAISGNSRAVFEYFHGYKLGLTATPKDYLKNATFDQNDPRAWEQRQLRDTYTTFGCKDSEPTFRYSLNDGVKNGYLISPIVIDARTDITTELLSKKGYSVLIKNEDGSEDEKTFIKRSFERKFTSEPTNREFCKAFIENAERDPISGETGKTIIFCVSQNHASKITDILNRIAEKRYPNKYQSNFAVQVTSNIDGSQNYSKQFANNNLNGHTTFSPEGYKSSKTRVCVTVGMMTTGYDCQDLLNIVLMRPIFSPTDFIQIKGRGTRTHTFQHTDQNDHKKTEPKQQFKIFDFFANCEYFEEDFKYDEALKIQSIALDMDIRLDIDNNQNLPEINGEYQNLNPDPLNFVAEKTIGADGMRIDREFFAKATDPIKRDQQIEEAVKNEHWEQATQIIRDKYENKPKFYLTLEKIRQSQDLDRNLTWREALEHIFGMTDGFKTKDELLNDECDKFITIHKPPSQYIPVIKNYLKAYISNAEFRDIINSGELAQLTTNPYFSLEAYQQLSDWSDSDIIPQYIHDNINFATYAVTENA